MFAADKVVIEAQKSFLLYKLEEQKKIKEEKDRAFREYIKTAKNVDYWKKEERENETVV